MCIIVLAKYFLQISSSTGNSDDPVPDDRDCDESSISGDQVGPAKTKPLSSMNSVIIVAFINALSMNVVMIATISHLPLNYHYLECASKQHFFSFLDPPAFSYGLTTLKLLPLALVMEPILTGSML